MKKILFGLIILFIGSQFLTSCSSESNVLSQFSKRKYMKRFKKKDIKYKDQINERENNYVAVKKVEKRAYANTDTDLSKLDLATTKTAYNKIEQESLSKKEARQAAIKAEFLAVQAPLNEVLVDYSQSYRINEMNTSSKELFINNYAINSGAGSSSVSPVVLAILCVFIPPLAVYLHESSITTNFWVDLVATLLFWIPGMILAFLIVFGGVSF